MYGLLLDSIQKFLREKYGEVYWNNIRRRAKLKNHWFVTHEVYPDSVMVDLVNAAAQELNKDRDTVMMMFGEFFAENIGRYGYARLLRILGRDLRDFLNGLDDLHEYLRFSYPKMLPPSFVCADETPEGMLLHYTTTRKGFLNYVIGQLVTVGKIYGKEVEVSMEQEETNGSETHYILSLKFDNTAMLTERTNSMLGSADFSISSKSFFRIFPFSFAFTDDLVIRKVGNMMQEVLPDLFGQALDQAFRLRKPVFGRLTWKNILLRANCTFELQTVKPIHRVQEHKAMEYSGPSPLLKLKGQMMLLDEIQHMVFLCSPSMNSPEELYESGIYINDLSMHDSSRDFILTGSQQNPELNLALSQEKIRSAQLEESIQKTDELLYQMIPKSIADKLRNGEPPLNTCKEFDSVSILFSDIVSFTPMCSRLKPMEVVCVLNSMYVAYDKLCEKNYVYKVETIGDAYMVLAGGPIATPHHAEFITNFAFGIIEATAKIKDPSTDHSLRVRVGIHSGPVVAGVVGSSILRYDVFGDTVNIAARMESTGEPMKIHVSEATANLLRGQDFIVVERGKVEVKGKGFMSTYWVPGKRPPAKMEDGTTPLSGKVKHTPSLRQSRSTGTTQPYKSWPVSPNHLTSTPVPPSSRARRFSQQRQQQPAVVSGLSPAPDQWPQADRQLNDRSSHFPMRTRQRTATLSTIDLSELGTELQAIFAHRNSLPLNEQSLSDSRASSVANFCTALRSNSITSEYDMARLRQSLSECLPTVSEAGESRLALFAHMAEENARCARQLANMASNLVRAEAQGRLSCPKESEECDDALRESSVDPPRFSPTPLPPSFLLSSGPPSPQSSDQRPLSGHATQATPPNPQSSDQRPLLGHATQARPPSPQSSDQRPLSGHATQASPPPPLTCPFASMARNSSSSSLQCNSTHHRLSVSGSRLPLPENHQNACCVM